MRKYKVYTENGDWEVYAYSAEAAARNVENISLGRCGNVISVQEVGK